MKLKNIRIRNFRSIQSVDIPFPDSGLLILVGSNNAGKSNIIKAVNNLLGSEWWSADKLHASDYFMREKDNKIDIRLTFDNSHTVSFRWDGNAEDYKAFYNTSYLSNDRKSNCPCTYLGADRTFDRHMPFYDWTLLGKIRKTFNERCGDLAGEFNKKFEEVVQLFNEVPGFTKFKQDFGTFFNGMQADAPMKMLVDFKPFTPNNYFKTMQVLAVDPSQCENNLDLEELGEGTRNLALIALLRSYAVNLRVGEGSVGGILALEEPEIYLHPQAQRNMFKILKNIAASGIQVIISTHSDCFMDTGLFDSIAVVRKEKPLSTIQPCTIVRQVSKKDLVDRCIATGVPAHRTTVENIGDHYRSTSNARLNEAFFARFVILTEGETEELVLPELLLANGLDCDMRGISVVGVTGKSQIPKYWRLFTAFNIPTVVVFDNDNNDDNVESNKNLAKCFDVELKTILEVSSWQQIDSVRTPITPLLIFEENFEKALKSDYAKCYSNYDQLETEAKEVIRPARKNQGKGLIARHIVRKMRADHPTYCPSFVRPIADHINCILGFSSTSHPTLSE